MAKLSESEIAEVISEGIHEPMKSVFQAVEQGGLTDEKRIELENALALSIAKAVFEAVGNGVTHSPKGRQFMRRVKDA